MNGEVAISPPGKVREEPTQGSCAPPHTSMSRWLSLTDEMVLCVNGKEISGNMRVGVEVKSVMFFNPKWLAVVLQKVSYLAERVLQSERIFFFKK